MDELLSERYSNELDGVLSCYDRIVITGSLYPFCYAQGMTSYLYRQGIRVFDYAKFAEPLRERLRENAEALAQANGIEIEFMRKKDFRKETRIQQILKARGQQPGLVHIIGAMEACSSYFALARQNNGQNIFEIRQQQMHDVLFLFHRRAAGTVLFACSNLVSFSIAVLFQWTQLAGQPIETTGHCLQNVG